MGSGNKRASRKGGARRKFNIRRKLLLYITAVMLVTTLLLTGVFWNTSLFHEIKLEKESQLAEVAQVLETIKNNETLNAEVRGLFVEDYLNRLRLVRSLLESNLHGNADPAKWQNIADTVDVAAIHVIGSDGVIVQSSAPASIGLDFYAHPELAEFIPLIESNSREAYYVDMEGISITTGHQQVYMGLRSDYMGGSVIQLEISMDDLYDYEDAYNIKWYVSTIPTRRYRTIFVVDGTTDELLGISENNKQTLEIDDRLETLRTALEEPQVIQVNGESQVVYVEEYNGMLIGCASTMAQLMENVKAYMVVVALCLVGLSALVGITLYFLIDWLMLRKVEEINSGLVRFVSGESDVMFGPGNTNELSELAENLNKVLGAIQVTGTRLAQVVNGMSQEVEAYEYYPELNQFFFSDHLLELMNMTEKECKDKIVEVFEKQRLRGEELGAEIVENVEYYITKDGRLLHIHRTVSYNASYAFVEDVSAQRDREDMLRQDLRHSEERSYVDELTGLSNRRRLAEYLEQWKKQNPKGRGVMLMMDLDNFKMVNDTAGHAEGDRLLRLFAQLLNHQFREGDIKARLGGDEFVVFLPLYVAPKEVERRGRRFLETVRQELREYYTKYHVSVSIGVAYMDENCPDLDTLGERADAAMYIAKRSGKDSLYIDGSSILKT